MKPSEASRSSEAIKTFARLKPILMNENSFIECDDRLVYVDRREMDPFEFSKTFFDPDKVFDGRQSNLHVFEEVMMPIIPQIFQGYNCTPIITQHVS